MLLAAAPSIPPGTTAVPNWLPWALLGAGVLILAAAGAWTLLSAKRRPAPSPATQKSPRSAHAAIEPKPGPPASLTDQAESLAALASDLEELTQRLAARLDAKASRLEVLIAQADDRIGRLAHLEQSADAARPADQPPRLRPATAPTSSIDDAAADPITRQIYALADEGLPAIEIARRLAQHTGKVELILALRQV